jgi:hypothetical protein
LDRRPPGYLDLAFAVLDAPPSAQSEFEDAMKGLRTEARRGGGERLQVCVAVISSGLTSLILAGSVYDDIERDVRNAMLTRALADAVRKHQCHAGLLIGRQLGLEQHTYSITLFVRASDLRAEAGTDDEAGGSVN